MQPKNCANVEELKKIWKMHTNLSIICECFHEHTMYEQNFVLVWQKSVLFGPQIHFLCAFSVLFVHKLHSLAKNYEEYHFISRKGYITPVLR